MLQPLCSNSLPCAWHKCVDTVVLHTTPEMTYLQDKLLVKGLKLHKHTTMPSPRIDKL